VSTLGIFVPARGTLAHVKRGCTSSEKHMSTASTSRRWITCLALSCLLVGDRVFAQSPARLESEGPRGRWGLVDALGYGGVGFLAGLAAAWDSEIGEGVTRVALSSLAGVVAGAAIGGHASNRIRRGEEVGGMSQFLVSTGTILGGATLGACAAVPLISGAGEGTPLGSDGTAMAILMGGGAVLGVWYLNRHRGDFSGARLGIAPIRTVDSAYGLRVSVRY
jgi:hypothetical protein